MNFFVAIILFEVIANTESRKRSPELVLPIDTQVTVCVTNRDLSTTAVTWNSPLPPENTVCHITYGKAKGAEIEFQHNTRPSSGQEFLHPFVKPRTVYTISASCTHDGDDHATLASKPMTFLIGVDFNKTVCSNETESLGPAYEVGSQYQNTAVVDHSYKMNITDLVIGIIVGSVGIGIIILFVSVVHARIKKWRRLRRFVRMRNDGSGLMNFSEDNGLASSDTQL